MENKGDQLLNSCYWHDLYGAIAANMVNMGDPLLNYCSRYDLYDAMGAILYIIQEIHDLTPGLDMTWCYRK